MNDESVQLLARYRDGDAEAADLIFRQYVARLVGLVRSTLSPKLNRRLEPEDVAQSVFRTFFHHAQDNRYAIEQSGDLWRLLAAIAINKTRRQVEFHAAAKRDVSREHASSSILSFDPAAVARDPRPEEAAGLREELEAVLSRLNVPAHRTMVELRLAGYDIPEIAERVHRSERMVRRVLGQIRRDLEERLRPREDGATKVDEE